jgi:hypothetical protein
MILRINTIIPMMGTEVVPETSVIFNQLTQLIQQSFEAEARVIIFKNSVRTAKKTPHFTVTKINRLTAV